MVVSFVPRLEQAFTLYLHSLFHRPAIVVNHFMRISARILLFVVVALCSEERSPAQLPFFTDDPAVTPTGTLHFEFFNESDGLQSSEYPNLRQNTANFKVNYGLPHQLELDLDAPYIFISRAVGMQNASGVGDTNLGVKWNFHTASQSSRFPTLGASCYFEFPTANARQQLSSGLTDYWLNLISQEPLTERTRINTNLGFLFAGNTSTGVIGIQTTRGHVYTGGVSLLHDFNPRLTFGGEVYGGVADNDGLARSQLQGLIGGQYSIRNGFSFTFALLGGKYVASPRVGAQFGFAVDFPPIRDSVSKPVSFITSESHRWSDH